MTRLQVAFWKRIPAFRLLLPTTAGIIIERYGCNPYSQWYEISILLLLILIFALNFTSDYYKFRFSFLNGVIANLLFFNLGGWVTYQANPHHKKDWYGHHSNSKTLLVTILESPIPRQNSWKSIAKMTASLNEHNEIQPISGKLLLYFSNNSFTHKEASILRPGMQLLLTVKPSLIPKPGNPEQFDYRQYCHFSGITHQAFLQQGNYILLKTGETLLWRKFLENSRNKILAILQKFIPNPQAAGLAEALVIGYKNNLDAELLDQYSKTGVVHIIAISGLHIGLIYALLKLLTRALPKKGRLRWLRFTIIFASIWIFSLMAGGQASILRSAVMFSFILIGENIGRKTNLINNLCCSALMLLLIQPYWLWDIGFQLSYAAVLSLALYMQPIYRSWYIPNKWLDQLWQMNAVTLAAQIITIPICIYYFHQFPTYFLLANLVCVPLSSALLLAAIILLGTASFSLLAQPLGQLINWGILQMNAFVEWITKLPLSSLSNLHINLVQAAGYYLFLIGFMDFLLWKNKWALRLTIYSSLFLVACFLYFQQQQSQMREWRIYHLNGHSSSDLIVGNRFIKIAEDSSGMKTRDYQFQLKNARAGLREDSLPGLKRILNGNAFVVNGLKVIIVEQVLSKPLNFSADILWVRKNAELKTPQLTLEGYRIGQIVLDGSLNHWKSRVWKQKAMEKNWSLHDVKTDGCFAVRWR